MRRVIKIGTSIVLNNDGTVNLDAIGQIASGIATLRQIGDSLILVVSGAVGMGRSAIAKSVAAPRSVSSAVGQLELMVRYQEALSPLRVGQLLVSAEHFSVVPLALRLQDTLHECFQHDILPLMNENDAVNFSASRIGDNDTLAALVASLIHADQLVLLSDVDGLYTDNPKHSQNARHIPQVGWVGPHHLMRYGDAGPGPFGTGGMTSKLKAAQIAQQAGIETLLMSGLDPDVWQCLRENDFGRATHFRARKEMCHA